MLWFHEKHSFGGDEVGWDGGLIYQNVYIGGTEVKSGFWVGIGFLGRGDFFQVELENSLYKKW